MEQSTLQSEQTQDQPEVPVQENQEEPVQTESPPVSEYEALQNRLAQNRYDSSGWNKLVDLAEQSGDLAKVKQAYESLLQAYPNTAEAQIAYLEHYLHPGLFPTAEALFNRFLRPSPSVRLWKFYLTYVRRMNADPSTREMVSKAYEFALMYIGHDKDSGEIWREYIDFVKAGETHTTWEEQQKMDALRRIYQRAVQIPLEIVEQLWSEYNAFEIGLNKITARKFVQDLSKAYMTAKEVLKTLRSHLAILFPPPANVSATGRKPFNLPEPTSPHSEGHRMLAKSWRAFLQWEEKNPLSIEEKPQLHGRIHATYKKAVIRMRFNPETWFMAWTWSEKHLKQEEAFAFLRAGQDANPGSFLLNFAYAEAQENLKNTAEVHAMYNKFIEVLHEDLEKIEKLVAAGDSLSSNGSTSTASTSSLSGLMSPQKELARRRTELGIAWIAYMRFARRAEGLKPARTVFGKARKDKSISWEIYEAAASMEYHFTKATDVATRIYETGLKQFGEDAEYVVRYLKFLISINDENNARALFERVITTFPADKARPIWETWANYEYNFGDLSAADKLEKRICEVYPDDLPMRRFAQRHVYGTHDAIAIRDLGWMPPAGSSGSFNGLLKNDSMGLTNITSSGSLGATTTNKRVAGSPERRSTIDRSMSQDMGPPPTKRAREASPPPRDRERDRRDRERERRDMPPPPRRRYGSPDWTRGSPPRRGGEGHSRGDWERESQGHEERTAATVVPGQVTFFLAQLPISSTFDGPVFRVDDLMQVFRNASIPSSAGSVGAPRPRSPPPRGRPPPDYGPYQGPGGTRGGRRY
ncbi:Suf-domain-containing protein [Ramaria rubella]|nr:Suf-domain-containing protein [Ramaria rubella]